MKSAVFRYRFFQYFEHLNVNVKYRKSLPDSFYNSYMPIGEKSILIKTIAYFIMLFRVSFFLFCDCLKKPDVIVISRTLIKPKMPFFYRLMLNYVKHNESKIYWDFDDNILEFKELTRSTFDYFTKISDKIIIASPYLKNLILKTSLSKVMFLPTTDGMLTRLQQNICKQKLLDDFRYTIKLLWIGTSSSLIFLERILIGIEDAAKKLKLYGKKIELKVVCDKGLQYESENFTYIFKKWSLEEANSAFLTSHIGLMPLDESLMAQGKGGFKLIQYLSIGIPSIASPVGINKEILSHGGGYLASISDTDKWSEYVVKLGMDIKLWESHSVDALNTYNTYYSYNKNFDCWKTLVK